MSAAPQADRDDALAPFLKYSFLAHGLLAAAVLGVLRGGSASKSPVYSIDFVGPAAPISGPSAAASPAAPQKAPPAAKAQTPAPARPRPQADFDSFGRRQSRRRSAPLPKPSLLKGYHPKPAPAEEPVEAPAEAAAPVAPAGGSIPGGAGGVQADMPDFPYPWYVSQVRAGLWAQWSARMPRQAGECVVVFSIMPNGTIVDLRTEESSGDYAYDMTALSAAQDAAPFPPLPGEFKEPFLKMHVTLRSN